MSYSFLHCAPPVKEDILVKNNLTEDRFGGGKNSMVILDALNEFMFKQSGFRGNTANYYNPANSFIDKVCTVKPLFKGSLRQR